MNNLKRFARIAGFRALLVWNLLWVLPINIVFSPVASFIICLKTREPYAFGITMKIYTKVMAARAALCIKAFRMKGYWSIRGMALRIMKMQSAIIDSITESYM